jgi:hypothetical protein
MSDELEIDLSNTTVLFYKDKNGAIKQLNVKQPINPMQIKFSLEDLQLLGKTISKYLREDAL